jgi:hypothetical protein
VPFDTVEGDFAFGDLSIHVSAVGERKRLRLHGLQLEGFPDFRREQRIHGAAVDEQLQRLRLAVGAGDGGVDVGEAHEDCFSLGSERCALPKLRKPRTLGPCPAGEGDSVGRFNHPSPGRSLQGRGLDEKTPRDFTVGGVLASLSRKRLERKKPGDTYFRAGRHYHRPGKLNGCVRNGNRCFLSGMVARRGSQRGEALRAWVDLVVLQE